MTSASSDTRLLLELYADGEIDERDRAEVERLLETDESAREYLMALSEMREAISLPIERAAETVSFDDLFARVDAALGNTELCAREAARDPELEMLAMAMADGEPLADAERARVDAYLAACAPARDGVAALGEIRELVRAPIERAADRVDFDLLARRIDSALDRIDAERATERAPVAAAAPEGLWSRFVAFVGGHRALVTSAVAAAAAAGIALSVTGGGNTPGDETPGQAAGTTVINNYYLSQPEIENTSAAPGFAFDVREGDPDDQIAPVIWIVPEDKPEDSYFDEPRPDADSGRPL